MTIIACPWSCGGVVNTAIANWCSTCGRDTSRTYAPNTSSDPEPRFDYDDPDRCTLRTKDPDPWGCHKIKGHTTGRGGRHCSTHLDCGKRTDGRVCGKEPGHDGGVHEIEPSGVERHD